MVAELLLASRPSLIIEERMLSICQRVGFVLFKMLQVSVKATYHPRFRQAFFSLYDIRV